MFDQNRVLVWSAIGLVLVCLTICGSSIAIADEGSIWKAEMLTQKADELFSQGRYSEAIPLAQKALAIREKLLGPEDPDTTRSLINLAVLYAEMGAYTKAEPLYQQALATAKKVFGPEHPDTARSLSNLAVLYSETGAYAQAEPLYRRALEIAEKVLGPEHPDTVGMISNLARVYHDSGDYAQAEILLRRSVEIAEKRFGPEHVVTARSLSGLAMMFSETGAYAEAEALYQRTLTISENKLGPEHPDTARVLNNLANAYRNMGAHTRAEPLLERALAITEKVLGPEHPETGNALTNLAGVYGETGSFKKAESLLRRALAITEMGLGSEHTDTSNALYNLANVYSDLEDYTQAKPLLERALAIRQKVLGPEHPDTANALENLARLRWTMGEVEDALPLFELNQVIRWKNAEQFLLSGSEMRKLAYVRKLRNSTSYVVSLSSALPGRRATNLGFTNVLLTKSRVLDAMSDSLGRIRQSLKPKDRELFEQYNGVVQQWSALVHGRPKTLKPDSYRQQFQELTAKKEQLETELSARSAEFKQDIDPVTPTTVKGKLPTDSALIEWIRYRPFNPHGKDWRFQWGKPRYLAYVMKASDEPIAEDVGDAETIERLIQEFRTGLDNPNNASVQEVANELYAALIKPLQRHLVDTKQLLVSPDGALNLVPFAALRDETGMYLGAKKTISYLASGRDLLRFHENASGSGDIVLVAAPEYGKTVKNVHQYKATASPDCPIEAEAGVEIFKPLTNTANEAKVLQGLFRAKTENVLTQENATETKLKTLHAPRILHIATHGFFCKSTDLYPTRSNLDGFDQDIVPRSLFKNPLLRSGLALAGANLRHSGETDDGILTAAEVAQMDLRGTQLVVLSACETGVGEVQNGEGVYGLRRALVLAGAETQVTSLWKVADDATKDLMVDYYQRLLKGEGRSEALRNAQLAMMKSKDRSHPYYWAAFVPIGDWRPLAKSH